MPGSGKSYHLFLLLTILLLGGPIAAQDTEKKQDEEWKKLLQDGSAAAVTKSIEKLEATRKSAHSRKNVEAEAFALVLIGALYKQLDQHQKATQALEQSLPLFRSARDRKGEATSLFLLGLIRHFLGEYQKAVDNLDQSARLSHAAADPEGEARALSGLGIFYTDLGKTEEAANYYNKALELYRAIGFLKGQVDVLTGLGEIYGIADQPEKARESFEQALSAARAAGLHYQEAIVLTRFGLFYKFLRNTQKAREYFEQALPLLRAEHDRATEAVTLEGLCQTELISGEYQRSMDYCSQALELQRMTGLRIHEALALKVVAFRERVRGNLAASAAAIESAITIIESLRTKFINPEFRLSFFTPNQDYYEFYIDVLTLLHYQHPNEGYDGKALEVSERARARSMLDTLAEANADIREGVDAALLQRQREIQRQLNARAQTQLFLPQQSRSEAQSKSLDEEIQTLIKNLQQIETEIRQTSPHYAALTQPRPLTLKEIQTQVLDDDTLLLEYSLGEESSHLWLVTSNSITSYELPSSTEIEKAARRFYDLLNARNVRVKGESNEERADRIAQADGEMPLAAESLSQMVLAPVAEKLGNKRLIIVADGALHFIPFGALPVSNGPLSESDHQRTKPLIVDHEIINLASASTLAVVRKEVAGRQIAPKSVVALADPVFMKNDERVKAANKSPAGDESAKVRQLVQAAAEDTGVASDGLYVPRLPGTRKEAEQIVAMAPPGQGRLALDFAASRETVMSAELSQYRYVHLSTHGFLNSVHPELSGVVFSLVNERGESQEGFLRSHELFNLKLPAEVVVLSACQTGLGKNIRGEGFVSLTRGFMYAGAPRVVVSLWAVSDWGTTELMVRFYQGMLKEGMRPAAALRAAQISLMNDKRFASPYFWAPFTLQGEWR